MPHVKKILNRTLGAGVVGAVVGAGVGASTAALGATIDHLLLHQGSQDSLPQQLIPITTMAAAGTAICYASDFAATIHPLIDLGFFNKLKHKPLTFGSWITAFIGGFILNTLGGLAGYHLLKNDIEHDNVNVYSVLSGETIGWLTLFLSSSVLYGMGNALYNSCKSNSNTSINNDRVVEIDEGAKLLTRPSSSPMGR